MLPALLVALQLTAATSTPGPSCGSAEHRQFDFWIGEWEVRGPQGRVLGYSSISPMLGGCAIREEWMSAEGRVRGESHNMYDTTDGRWHQAWTDNAAKRLALTGGLVGRDMVMEQRDSSAAGTVVVQRITWSPLPTGGVRQHWQVSRDGGTTWTTSFDGLYGRRVIGVLGPASPTSSSNVPSGAGWLTTSARVQWTVATDLVLAAAEAMPADRYGDRPTPGVRTFLEQVNHASEVLVQLVGWVSGRNPKVEPEATPSPVTRDAALAELRRAIADGTSTLQGLDDARLGEMVDTAFFGKTSKQDVLAHAIGHTNRQYGQLVVYLRRAGIVPPASRQP